MLKKLLLAAGILVFGQASYSQTIAPKTTGYTNISELTFARGIIHENSDLSFGFRTINGYRFNEHVSAGMGVGIDKYVGESSFGNQKAKALALLPVFTDVRIYFGKGNTQPFFAQAVGYAFCVDQPVAYMYLGEYDEKGGILINPSFGFQSKLGNHTSLKLSLGYRYQENTQEITTPNYAYGYYYGYIPEGTQLNRFDHYLTFNAGISF